ncbi:MAG: glycoside hydrolase family 2 protein [Clostridia bacterium]|jgi:beta-galactosidase/beta-glucuronidase
MNKQISIPRPEYPRPDFERQDWVNLNGVWEFAFDDEAEGIRNRWYEEGDFPLRITVPFCYQSLNSGVEDKSDHEIVWYKREFSLPRSFQGKKILLHFGAVDFYAMVWVNGRMVGEHKGGYTPFRFDITDYLEPGNNRLVVRVEDRIGNTSQPRGKQSWKEKNFNCWYTRVTGIWQTVWLEAVGSTYIDRVKLTPDLDAKKVKIDAFLEGPVEDCILNTVITIRDVLIADATIRVTKSIFSYTLDVSSDAFEWKVLPWDTDNPNLYDVEFRLSREGEQLDRVKSYFGLRKISTKDGMVLLNNRPIFQRLVLDQGYFDGGLLTAARDEDYIRDIQLTKEFGFNGVRKHQKLEDPRYLYWADKMGLLVWSEMGSAYEFNDTMMEINMKEWEGAVARDYNHPSIIAWTLMNESWGIPNVLVDQKQQHHTLALYYMVKAYDSTRLVISNDGWEHTLSDIVTFHDYTQDGDALARKIASKEKVLQEPICSIGDLLGAKYLFAEGYSYRGQPILLSECAGVAFAADKGWGYGESVHTKEEFLERYAKIIGGIYRSGYIVGFCCTQLTDVEQEVNGLLTMDRKPKVDPVRMARIILGE